MPLSLGLARSLTSQLVWVTLFGGGSPLNILRLFDCILMFDSCGSMNLVVSRRTL